MSWKKVSKPPRLPEDHKENDLGIEYLVWPRLRMIGGTAFFGTRATGSPCFYRYGAQIHGLTHWDHLPKGPAA